MKRNRIIRGGHCLFLAVLLMIPAACSVKEVRSDCPVYVTVLTDRFVQQGLDAGVISFASGAWNRQETVRFVSYVRGGYEQACSREFARAAVFSGAENSRLSGDQLSVMTGCPSGQVWAYGVSFSADCDEYIVDAVPHKQYCRIRFLFDGNAQAPEDYPWHFRLKAECSGFNIYTLAPVEGEYCMVVGPDALGEWIGVLPRQKRNSMRLEFFVPEDGTGIEGRTDHVVDLGAVFEKQGYDWRAEDLKDMEVRVGYSQAEICVTVREWEGDDTYSDIEI